LSFYDADGNRVATQPGLASAETEHAGHYAAGMAFNENTHDDDSFYCSQSGVPTGWLQYQFESGTAPIASYRVERLNGHGNQFSPVSWQIQQSLDGGQTWTVIDEQSGISTWHDGEIKSFTPGVAYAHGPMFKIDVSENAGAGHWCIEELSFYDADGNRVATQPGLASAETEFSVEYAAGMAFNAISAYCSQPLVRCSAETSSHQFYCSQSGVPTGWLQYQFESGTAPIASYRVERLNGHGNEFSPVSWQIQQSLDGGQTWTVIDEQSGISTWSDGEIKSFTPGVAYARVAHTDTILSGPERPLPGPVTLLSGNAHCPDCSCDVSVADPHWPAASCRSMFDDVLRWDHIGHALHLHDGASLTLTFPEAVQVDHIDLQQIQNHGDAFWRGDFSVETFNNGVWTVQGHVDDVPVSQLPMSSDGRFVFPLAAPVTTTQVRMVAGEPHHGNGAIFRLEELQVYGRSGFGYGFGYEDISPHYSTRQSGQFFAGYAAGDSAVRSISEAQAACDALEDACGGITCGGIVFIGRGPRCTVRAGTDFRTSPSGEFSYLRL